MFRGTTYQLHDFVLVSDDNNNTLEGAKVCKLIDLYDTGSVSIANFTLQKLAHAIYGDFFQH